MPLLVPILAADIGTVISVAILIIGFLGWIRQQIVHNQPAAVPPRPPRPPQRDERVQNEIEIFLQEVGGKKGSEPHRAEEVAIEIVPESERRARPAPARARPTRRPAAPPRVPAAPVRDPAPAPRRAIAPTESAFGPAPAGAPTRTEAAREAERLGAGILAHLQSYMGSGRLDKQVEERLRHEIGQFAREQAALSAPPAAQPAVSAPRVAALLRDPGGMRQAIVMNEILSRPKALRR